MQRPAITLSALAFGPSLLLQCVLRAAADMLPAAIRHAAVKGAGYGDAAGDLLMADTQESDLGRIEDTCYVHKAVESGNDDSQEALLNDEFHVDTLLKVWRHRQPMPPSAPVRMFQPHLGLSGA